jgi:amidase
MNVMSRAARTLLASGSESAIAEPSAVYILHDAFALADEEVRQSMQHPLEKLHHHFGNRVREVELKDIIGNTIDSSLEHWCQIFCVLQWAEIHSCLGAWIAAAKPDFGPATAANFELAAQLDRRRIADAAAHRERLSQRWQTFFGPDDLLCMPTTPAVAPRKGDTNLRSSSGSGYYPRTLALTSIAGIGRLPQISLPSASCNGVPIGFSLLAKHGRDIFLLQVAESLCRAIT